MLRLAGMTKSELSLLLSQPTKKPAEIQRAFCFSGLLVQCTATVDLSCELGELFGFIGFFPTERAVAGWLASEMAVSGGRLVDRPFQIEHVDDAFGAQIERLRE